MMFCIYNDKYGYYNNDGFINDFTPYKDMASKYDSEKSAADKLQYLHHGYISDCFRDEYVKEFV